MIKGFEIQTQPLNKDEMDMLPVIIQGLMNKVGKDKAVTNNHICKRMTGAGFKLNPARLRKIINHIRVNNMIHGLIATSDGYYIAENKNELMSYIDSLKGRESAIRDVRNAIEKQMEFMY